MEKLSELPKIDILRDLLRHNKDQTDQRSKNKLSLTPVHHAKKSSLAFSRDVSYILDPQSHSRSSSKDSLLLHTLSVNSSKELGKRLTLDEPQPESSKSLEDRLEEALAFFSSDSKEGLFHYKSHTSLTLEHLEQIYKEKLFHQHKGKFALSRGSPSGRREIKLLVSWLSCMLEIYVKDQNKPVYQKVKAYALILKVCLKELVRQVKVQCNDRGELLDKVVQGICSSITMICLLYTSDAADE